MNTITIRHIYYLLINYVLYQMVIEKRLTNQTLNRNMGIFITIVDTCNTGQGNDIF